MTSQNFKQRKARWSFDLSALAAVVRVATQVLSSNAMAWGIIAGIGDPASLGSAAHLTYAVLVKKQIQYCVDNFAPKDYDTASISTQVEAALSLWLTAANYRMSEVPIIKAPCGSGSNALRIVISPNNPNSGLRGAATGAHWARNIFYSEIDIDSNSQFISTNGTKAFIFDFKDFLDDLGKALGRSNFGLIQAIRYVSFENHLGSADVAQLLDTAPDVISGSTYTVLIHEMGHAFGLCDTYGGNNCASGTPPPEDQLDSVMKSNGDVFLEPDDIAGIRGLFDHYRRLMQK